MTFSAIKMVIGMFFMVCIGGLCTAAYADNHANLPQTPCDIRLSFGTDDTGMPTVSYKLVLQIQNRAGRAIQGVSLYWLDDNGDVIGNSNAVCGADETGIAPSEVGPCKQTVQQIGGPLLQRLGTATWTEIINNELTNFQQVKRCAILGYDYLGPSAKTY